MAKTQTTILNLAAAYMRLYERHAVNADLNVLLRQYVADSKKGRLPMTAEERYRLQLALDDMLARRKEARIRRGKNLDMKESVNPVLDFLCLPVL
jgi:hypothetical protein